MVTEFHMYKRQLLLLVFVIYNFTMQFATLIATTTESHISPLNYLLIQWRIQGRGPGDPLPPYLWTKLRPEGPKKCFWKTAAPAPPPPHLPYLLISRSGTGTVIYYRTSRCTKNATSMLLYRCEVDRGRLMHAVSIQ